MSIEHNQEDIGTPLPLQRGNRSLRWSWVFAIGTCLFIAVFVYLIFASYRTDDPLPFEKSDIAPLVDDIDSWGVPVAEERPMLPELQVIAGTPKPRASRDRSNTVLKMQVRTNTPIDTLKRIADMVPIPQDAQAMPSTDERNATSKDDSYTITVHIQHEE